MANDIDLSDAYFFFGFQLAFYLFTLVDQYSIQSRSSLCLLVGRKEVILPSSSRNKATTLKSPVFE